MLLSSKTPHFAFICLISLFLSLNLRAQDNGSREEQKVIKIGVIGASVSAGFGSGNNLSEALSAAIHAPHKMTNLADTLFFMKYMTKSPKDAQRLKKEKVDIVVGLDYLFWFATGDKTLAQRKTHITKAIEFLDDLSVPIVIGTIPAMKGISPMMLPKKRIIPEKDVPILNEHLCSLLKTRANMRTIPLAQWIDCLNSGKKVPGMDQVSEKALTKKDVFLADGLHLNRQGLVFGAAMIVAKLQEMDLLLTQSNATHKVRDILKTLAKNEKSLAIMVLMPGGKLAKEAHLRFELPKIREIHEANMTKSDKSKLFMKLRSLRKDNRGVDLKDENPYQLSAFPTIPNSLIMRVRAEGPHGGKSPWRILDLNGKKKKKKNMLVLKIGEPISLAVHVVSKKTGEPIAGVQVMSLTESQSYLKNLKKLPPSFPARATTDAKGVAVLTGLGPEAHELSLTIPGASKPLIKKLSPGQSSVTIKM